MFEETLVEGARDLLALLGQSHLMDLAYLAGGTALALQMGHRISVDFDFFTSELFDPEKTAKNVGKLAEFRLEQASHGTILGELSGIRFSLFHYPYPLLRPTKKYWNIQLADTADLAAMKIAAIAQRGIQRDFVDLYVLGKKYSLNAMLAFYNEKFKNLVSMEPHILKSLVYFHDAEKTPTPRLLQPLQWKEIKHYFESEVKQLVLPKK